MQKVNTVFFNTPQLVLTIYVFQFFKYAIYEQHTKAI